jgi:ATP-dependent helicase Lhr and Lhr-like helicase
LPTPSCRPRVRCWSCKPSGPALPSPTTLLGRVLQSREGTHLFIYPFAGRHAHLGLANLMAWRVAQRAPNTFSIAVNDYGFELLSATDIAGRRCCPSC